MKLLLTGASDLKMVDTKRTEIFNAFIASVLPAKTNQGIQGEESGCR